MVGGHLTKRAMLEESFLLCCSVPCNSYYRVVSDCVVGLCRPGVAFFPIASFCKCFVYHGLCRLRLEGFEPPTYGSVGHCSIQLSYRRESFFYKLLIRSAFIGAGHFG